MRPSLLTIAICLPLLGTFAPAPAQVAPGEVAIYTGLTQWISKLAADEQAQICVDKLTNLLVPHIWYQNETDVDGLAEWVLNATDNGKLDVLVLYGDFPPTIYPDANAQPDGSLAELFIESTDGDAIINHADYMFWGFNGRNSEGGLQNMMDIPTIVMWDDDTPVEVTPEGKNQIPSLTNFLSDRPFHLDELAGEWAVEVSFAQNAAGTRADPVIVRDGDRGRLIPVFQTNGGNEPKGAVAAEIICYLGLSSEPCVNLPTKHVLSGRTASWVGDPVQATIQLQDDNGTPATFPGTAVTVNLQTDSGTGAFDTAANGPFDGSVTSVTIPAGERTLSFFYKDTAAGTKVLTSSAAGLGNATMSVNVFAKTPPSAANAGEVAIYTGVTQWVLKGNADIQAQITVDLLDALGITQTWFQTDQDLQAVADWVEGATDNGKVDVLVLYGDFPPSIYPDANALPDGSLAELFIESTDGDAIINHADYMFYGLNGRNMEGGLQNLMDIPGIVMWDDNTSVAVTDRGKSIAPSLPCFSSDRPFHVDQLAGDWLVEEALAQNAAGTRADPIIVRDGNRGRLIPVMQVAPPEGETDPKGVVGGEIIAYLMGVALGGPTNLAFAGPTVGITGRPSRLLVRLEDFGAPRPSQTPTTVSLQSDSATGAFDTSFGGSFDGTVNSVTIPAGALTASFYFKETAAKSVTITATAAGLAFAEHTLNVLATAPVEQGEVALYTGTVQWVGKLVADGQAQTTAIALDAAGITNTLYPSELDMQAVADWAQAATDNGKLDVLVLYGDFPPPLYPEGNTMPDGSIAELFIESTDGDAIINHGDYMFWGLNGRNQAGGLQNMMDIPDIVMGEDNTALSTTDAGSAIAPTLPAGFTSDRPLHLDQLINEWFPEVILAEGTCNANRADPVIVRDGDRGRLIPALQSAPPASELEPKGAVAAEIIIWLMQQTGQVDPFIFRRGDSNASGDLNITDGVFVLNYLFLGGPEPTCQDAADSDDNGQLNITDGVRILNYLFLGGPAPPAPGPNACGPDTVEDDLPACTYLTC